MREGKIGGNASFSHPRAWTATTVHRIDLYEVGTVVAVYPASAGYDPRGSPASLSSIFCFEACIGSNQTHVSKRKRTFLDFMQGESWLLCFDGGDVRDHFSAFCDVDCV